MRPKPLFSILVFYILLLSGMLFSPSVLHAEKRENLNWSVNFNNIAISEALDQLTRLTQIKINTNKPIGDRIKKSYQNRTINEILRDMLKRINHASVWSYEEAGVDVITIWVFEKSVGGAGGMPVPRIPVIDDQELLRRTVRPRVPPQRRAIQAEQPSGDIVQQDRESESSNESEDQNAPQDEEKEQESTRAEKEADDTSKADEKSDTAEANVTEKSSETPSEEKKDSKDSEKNEGTESQSSDLPSEQSEKNQ